MMKRKLFFVPLIWGVLYAAALAETRYVTGEVTVLLRRGPTIEHKIIAMLKSGQEAEVINSGDQWSEIRLPDGKEGWILSRYLTDQKPAILEVESLKTHNETMLAKLEALSREHKDLQETNKKLAGDLAEKQKAFSEVSQAHEQLKTESSEFLKLKADAEEMSRKLAEQTDKLEKLDRELSRMQTTQIFRWVLTGAGILLLGFVLGFSTRPQRKRSSLL